jgi:hypothetical protein
MQQFVRNWGQTGIVINHLDTSLLTQLDRWRRDFSAMQHGRGGRSEKKTN